MSKVYGRGHLSPKFLPPLCIYGIVYYECVLCGTPELTSFEFFVRFDDIGRFARRVPGIHVKRHVNSKRTSIRMCSVHEIHETLGLIRSHTTMQRSVRRRVTDRYSSIIYKYVAECSLIIMGRWKKKKTPTSFVIRKRIFILRTIDVGQTGRDDSVVRKYTESAGRVIGNALTLYDRCSLDVFVGFVLFFFSIFSILPFLLDHDDQSLYTQCRGFNFNYEAIRK